MHSTRKVHLRTHRSARQSACRNRSGITLLEVVLALAIFVVASAVISEIIRTGASASVRAELQSSAVLRAETRLNEVLAGVYPLEPMPRAEFEDDRKWTWALAVNQATETNLLAVEVTVTHVRENGDEDAEFRVSRLVRDPQIFLDAAAAESSSLLPVP